MSVRLGTNIIAGRSPYQPSLFDFKWADHILNDPQWVRADLFKWHSRSVFTAAYDHLVADIQGKDSQSETIEGIIITYYLANDGHKICLSDQEEYIKNLYEKTGVAWYYIIDTASQSFKVPRTKWGFEGIKDGGAVGTYTKPGLPNIKGAFNIAPGVAGRSDYGVSGAFVKGTNVSDYSPEFVNSTDSGIGTTYFDASKSNSIYGNSDEVQTTITQSYLYFYVGNFTQTAIENTAGANLEDIEAVMDDAIDAVTAAVNNQYHNILEFKWSDHILNDIRWLRADTFSWQSGDVYESAYQHLVEDIASKILTSETISGTTISYYLADDGHKICPATQESNVVAIYEATGIAWYYILDITNERFKLPRTTFGFTGKRDLDTVGKYVAPGLPNITGQLTPLNRGIYRANSDATATGALTFSSEKSGNTVSTASGSYNASDIKFDASASNAIYGASTTVQAPATEMYLYFYVGTFLQSAIVNTAGIAAEQLNTLTHDVIDLNAHKVIEFQAPTSTNNYTWYRKYADGWVEQGGIKRNITSGANTNVSVALPVPMADLNYTAVVTAVYNGTGDNTVNFSVNSSSTTTTLVAVKHWSNTTTDNALVWAVSGMAASN